MKKKDIEIPFGAFDSELGGFEYTIPEGYKAEIKDGKVVVRKTESDDERIRKEIIATIHLYYGEPLENEAKEMIAWLEKQGEKGTNGNKGEFPIPEPPLTLKHAKEVMGIEQKPVWSEEDEENLNWFEKFFRAESVVAGGKDIPQDKYLWFKNLKDRVQPQPKQEWSEEDQKIASRIASVLEEAASEHAFMSTKRLIGDKEVIEIEGWLKSLEDRYTWKPSEEQIDALEDAIADAVSSIQKNMLNSLYSDLKKL